ncbi:MAG: hypothetical protein M9962_07605 [Oligoflexia bacterium]|nr:hypothetical protein [Oligoflexia bacterium]
MHLFLSIFLTFSTFASMTSDFSSVMEQRKGPFDLNVLQGEFERIVVTEGRSPKNLQFQAAFRNPRAQNFALDHGVYLGNLFTTNYYELMGEFVYNNTYGSHAVDHQALLSLASQAMPKASLMVRNWVLEKSYLTYFPTSKLARVFALRGISGAEFELEYANYFFNFYLNSLENTYQYLPAFLLAVNSPIIDSASLAKARNLISESYDSLLLSYGKTHPMIVDLYKIRNTIHNQLSIRVISEIDRFLSKYSEYRYSGDQNLYEIRKILVSYYNFSASGIRKQAKAIGLNNIQAAAEKIEKSGVNESSLLVLAQEAANLRTNISNASYIAFHNKAKAIALLADVSRYINKEVLNLSRGNAKTITEILLHTIYVEGFLIKDNWEYYVEEIRNGSSSKENLSEVIDLAISTLEESFQPTLGSWIKIEPKMQYFLDNTIKSSAVNSAAYVLENMGR